MSDTADRQHRTGMSALVMGLGVLAVGAIVAVVGISAGVRALADRQEHAAYADTRAQAIERLDAGDQAVALGQELCSCDARSRDLANEQVEALRAADAESFNSLVEEFNVLATTWNELIPQIEVLLPGPELHVAGTGV
ncbi:MAG: hypothetical protein JXA83_03495 [Acidimicrobiales bacterium]|nr:hypothetical protein [Acidimicrobiales bacterium]